MRNKHDVTKNETKYDNVLVCHKNQFRFCTINNLYFNLDFFLNNMSLPVINGSKCSNANVDVSSSEGRSTSHLVTLFRHEKCLAHATWLTNGFL